MNKDKFISDAKEKRRKYVEALTLEVLSKMLKDNLRYLDAHYINDRVLEILEKTANKINFHSEEIQKARRVFLDVVVDGAKKQLFGFEDDYKQAKENIKSKDKDVRHKAIEACKQIERMKNKTSQGLTEKRNMECEPVCQFIASKLLDKEFMIKDEDFVNGIIELDNELMFSTLYKTLFNELFDQLITSLDRSYIGANEANWGCRRDEIRLQQIDNRLKKQ